LVLRGLCPRSSYHFESGLALTNDGGFIGSVFASALGSMGLNWQTILPGDSLAACNCPQNAGFS
jgi:hypothetical protein